MRSRPSYCGRARSGMWRCGSCPTRSPTSAARSACRARAGPRRAGRARVVPPERARAPGGRLRGGRAGRESRRRASPRRPRADRRGIVLLAYLAFGLACLWAHRAQLARAGAAASVDDFVDAVLFGALPLFALSSLNPQYFALDFAWRSSASVGPSLAVQVAGLFLVVSFFQAGALSARLFTPLSPGIVNRPPDPRHLLLAALAVARIRVARAHAVPPGRTVDGVRGPTFAPLARGSERAHLGARDELRPVAGGPRFALLAAVPRHLRAPRRLPRRRRETRRRRAPRRRDHQHVGGASRPRSRSNTSNARPRTWSRWGTSTPW